MPTGNRRRTDADPDATRTIDSHLLGELTLTAEQVVAFPEGLHGFPTEREFALVDAARDGFWWLQSTTEAALAFLLVDPFRVQPDYEVDLSPGDEAFLAFTSAEQALVLTVVTLPSSANGTATTNLRGPIVINLATRRARQVVRADERYDLRAPVPI